MNMKVAVRPYLPLLALSLCLLFLGINGLVGGYLMLMDPNGAPMGMPVSDLAQTPFQNYVVPGLILIFVWGCGSLLALIGLWLRPQLTLLNLASRLTHEHWAWALSLVLGLALLVWLTVQVLTLPNVAPIQFILYVLAALLVVLPLLPKMRQYYRADQV